MSEEIKEIDAAAAALDAMKSAGVDPCELMEVLSGFTINLGLYAASDLGDEYAGKILQERMRTPQGIGQALDAAHYEAEQKEKQGALAKVWELVGPLFLKVLSKAIMKG